MQRTKHSGLRHALILAAGRGSRMLPLTDIIPKPMAPYLNTTLIGHGISQLKDKVANIHITVGYKKSMMADHVLALTVDTVINTDGKGNCWVIFNSLISFLNEPILVLTADNICELDFDFIFSEYQRLGEPACMLVPVQKIKGIEGDFIHSTGNVVNSLSRNIESDCYASGIQVVNPTKVIASVDATENFSELWEQLISQRKLYSSEIYTKPWFSVDTLDQLSNLIQRKLV